MRSNRLLAMLLVVCMVVSLLAPAASAVDVGASSFVNANNDSNSNASTNKTSRFENDRVVSKDTAGKDTLNLRDDPIELEVVEKNESEGKWEVTPAEKPEGTLTQTTVPAWLEELKEAASLYKIDEVVRAFVVMEGAALAESHTSPLLVSASVEQQMIQKQDSVIAAIERTVMNGKKLEVRYQFTYLANAFSVETEFANLEKIAKVSGVKSVILVPTYDPCAVSNPNTASSGAMTGVHTVWEDLGYTGEGMKIAIIDTGLDLDHPSFGALNSEMVNGNDSYLSMDDVAAVVERLNAYERRGTIVAKHLYRSTKVPYAFNYCDNTLVADHSMDEAGDHGTHVAGIAAANKISTTDVVGMAPDAQIIVMKVFGAAGGAYTDDIIAALEDAMILGCDVVNASLGSAGGFSATGEEYIDSIYDLLANQNIVATISAGNEGTNSDDNMWGTDLNRTQNPENGTIGSPSLYDNAFSIASAENCEVQTPFFTLGNGTTVFFNNDTYGYYYGYTPGMAPMIGFEAEYVMIDGLGNEEDYYDEEGNSLVEGKVAVVSRGQLSFGEKIFNAELAGAIACIIFNNVEDDVFEMMMNDTLTDAEGNSYFASIPACMISLADGQKMAACEEKTMTVSEKTAARVVEGGQMSSFSSWGTSSDLRLVPDITGIGGNVYSCYDNGQYGLMSGTSMSAPQIAGISALVMQYLYDMYPNAANDGSISDLARALLMSTADPIVADNDVEASPRQQGAGLVNAAEAVNTKAYLTVNGGRPKAELGDSKAGRYSFTFEINNMSDEAQTYVLSSSLLTEDFVDYGIGEYFMAGQDVELTGKVTFDKDTVTVPANGTVSVTVSIALSDTDKAMFARYWENGGYVEGYVYLENADEYGVNLNLPFMGFYGDWTQAPVFDTAYWYENSFWSAPTTWPDGDEYWHVLWTDLAGQDWVLGFNPYSGAYTDAEDNIVFDPANISVSPNGDGVVDGITEIYLSLLRNAKTLTFTYSNAETGEILFRETTVNNSKTMYISSYGQIIPWIHSWYSYDMFDFSGLPNDTQVKLTVEATVDYEGANEHTLEFVITVDTEAPVVEDAYQVVEADGSHSLVVVVRDNVNVGGIFLMNPSGSQIYGVDYALEARGDGSYVATFNAEGLGTELLVVAGDYAGNESAYEINYTVAGDNLPEMDTDLLYAYRVYDEIIEYYQGYDYMFGWTAMDKPENGYYGYSWLEPLTNDYMETYALTAAEYAGGKIFAVDAGYNLVVMDPGLWNRTTLCNLGVSVLDMTFDDSTDTMYLLAKEDSYYVYLMKLDLMSGEMEQVAYLGTYNRAPIALTDDDNGTLYAVKYGGSNLYTMTEETEWAMTPVTVAVGTDEESGETLYDALVLIDSYGQKTAPRYAQSMTYVDGKIYWAYMSSNYYSEYLVIDTESFEYSNHPIITYYDFASQWAESAPELVGLISLQETEYQLPEAEALEALNISDEMLILAPGQSGVLGASATPWNYKLENLTWTSSDESVATVSNGKVTAIAEGTAVITVSCEGVEASCEVMVVNTKTTFNAYNYFSGDGYYGYMIEVDTGSMNYTLLQQSPADFIAADYNGHDGYYYGYTEGGQFWRMDLQTGKAVRIGDPIGANPADMAYDYSSGIMYVLIQEASMWSSVSYVCAVDLMSGQYEVVFSSYEFAMMTLACDLEGNIYSLTADGMLIKLSYVYDDWWEEYSWMPELLMADLGYLQYLQSMCYDYANDVILWAYPEAGNILWLDPNAGYAIGLGDPTGTGVFEFVGMYTVPEEIPALPEVPVIFAEASDMMLLVGATKTPVVSIYPTNATCKDILWTSSDPSIAAVTEDGIKGVSEGTTEITGVLNDTIGGETIELTMNVTVAQGADDIYGFILTDFMTMGGQVWSRLYATDTNNPDLLQYSDYIIFAAEQYDGVLYAYGYDPNDWEANWQFFIMDAETLVIEDQLDMGAAFPFVYDMTYDYNTSTMYATAGPSDDDANLYIVDMETGALVLLMQTEQFFMSIAAAEDGIYLMESSQDIYDEWGDYLGSTSAQLYKLDTDTMTIECLGETGINSNMLASMSYDYDTGMMYWTPTYQSSSYESSLAMIDLATATATPLGMICSNGAQVGSLFILCEEFPEEEDTLYGAVIPQSNVSMTTGDSVQVNVVTMPMGVDADIAWESADETIATVDEDGVITAVQQGRTTITATVTYKGITKVCTCSVGVMDAGAAFLSWNRTDMGWSTISRQDYTIVENLTEGEEIGVSAIDAVENTVYGVDAENQLFVLDLNTFEREILAQLNADDAIAAYMAMMEIEDDDPANYAFDVRDMAYDESNQRMLVLGTIMGWDAYWEEWSELTCGSSVYALDLTTGELENLYCFEDADYVYSLAVDNEGTVYYYATFNDHICKLDLETGVSTLLISTQTQSLYGEYGVEMRHAMYYDELSNSLYMLFTSNSNYYRMLIIDVATGTLTATDEYGDQMFIGEVAYDYDSWAYVGDLFSAIAFVDIPEPEYEVVFKSANTNMDDGNINLNFAVTLSDNVLTNETSEMHFTFNGTTQIVPMSEAVQFVKNGETRYRFACSLPAKHMADDVVAQMYIDGEPVGESKTYSIQAYCQKAIEVYGEAEGYEALVALMKAMLNYGAATQVHFGHNTDNLANAVLADADKVLADVDASAYAVKITGAEDGIIAKSAYLVLESDTILRVSFQLTGDKAIDDYTFTVDGQEVTPVLSGDRYYVEVADIAVTELDEVHNFTVGGLNVACSALTYVEMALKSAHGEDVKDMVKALYAFYTAAEAYFG